MLFNMSYDKGPYIFENINIILSFKDKCSHEKYFDHI